MKLLSFALLLFVCAARAATTIEVAAHFADVPAGTEVPATPEKLDKLKGIEVLAAPRVTTTPGKSAVIAVTQDAMVPGAAAVPLGVTLNITPTLGEKTIHFTGKATDRATSGKRSAATLNTIEFATREIYFEGSVANGGTILLQSTPVTAKGEKNTTSRQLIVFLQFTKKVTPDTPTKKPAATPAKKPATSAQKPAAKKK